MARARACCGTIAVIQLLRRAGQRHHSAPNKSGQFYGKLMVDMETGNIWGFPTIVASPYPVDAVHTAPPTSHPVYLGRYDLAATRK